METYKKPVVSSISLSESTVMRTFGAPPSILEKLFGVNNFHAEKSLTPRKNITK